MTTATKTIDAVGLKRRLQSAFQRRIAGKTRHEELALYATIERQFDELPPTQQCRGRDAQGQGKQ